jgi:hypothetical protein
MFGNSRNYLHELQMDHMMNETRAIVLLPMLLYTYVNFLSGFFASRVGNN